MKTDPGAASASSPGGASGSYPQRIFQGVGVSVGVAVGTVYLHDAGMVQGPEYTIPANRIEAEKKRFQAAVNAAARQVERLQSKASFLPAAASEELGFLLDAYQQMLKGSRLVRGVERRIAEERINAEAAVRQEISLLLEVFAAMDDAYLAGRAADIRDVGQRLVRNLTKTPYKAFAHLPRNAVILASDLSPADTALLDPKLVAGFATCAGGAESHTAIMARSLAIPAVVGVADMLRQVRQGAPVILDGIHGRIILDPTPETLADYRKQRAELLRQRRALSRLKDLPAVTTDGLRVALMANIELPSEIDAVLAAGAEGIGLFRTEFLYMNRHEWPNEDEQYAILRDVVCRMQGRPVTIRTLDAGGDKLDIPGTGGPATNPALGLRAVRFQLAQPDVMEAQLAAILRAAAHGPVRILVPMISSVDEITQVRAVLERVHRRLKRSKVEVPAKLPPLGIMIEIPGAALSADALACEADFFAIGTNDLTQYTLAIDRGDEAVAHLFNPQHPAVLRLIHFTTGAAMRARIPVSVCGEMAGDPRVSALLIGFGIDQLSMSAASIPRVKQRIRRLAQSEAQSHTRQVMSEHDPHQIEKLIFGQSL
ncbi:phosphoenolpyruvate--protein phosphotransferase [Insolitispirillum peregrinum]|uniref:phosphoenolpyruvate--protein phosphotransferase n=1 Tax=Insolitispirillum peregrinum TaxID=80876 RepID=UPI00361BED41